MIKTSNLFVGLALIFLRMKGSYMNVYTCVYDQFVVKNEDDDDAPGIWLMDINDIFRIHGVSVWVFVSDGNRKDEKGIARRINRCIILDQYCDF